jgi:hypothetical protein
LFYLFAFDFQSGGGGVYRMSSEIHKLNLG